MVLTVSFEQHIDPDIAQIQVQNRVSRALPRLPPEVQRIGVVTEKTAPDVLMVVHLLSPEDATTAVRLQLRDAQREGRTGAPAGRRRRDHRGGGEYAMRVWLDPEKVASRG
jgi:gold/copper resistance efflux pump